MVDDVVVRDVAYGVIIEAEILGLFGFDGREGGWERHRAGSGVATPLSSDGVGAFLAGAFLTRPGRHLERSVRSRGIGPRREPLTMDRQQEDESAFHLIWKEHSTAPMDDEQIRQVALPSARR